LEFFAKQWRNNTQGGIVMKGISIVLVLAGLCFYFYDVNQKKERELQASYESRSRLESKMADVSRKGKQEVARLTAIRDKMFK
jgi:hypothetical protein